MIATNAAGGALSAGFITKLQSTQESPRIVFNFQADSTTDLNEDLDAVEAGIDVVDSSVFTDGDIIQIDDEFMLVIDDALGVNQIEVTRGYKWNPAATHSNGADIFLFNEYEVMSVSDLSIDPDMGASEAVVTVSNADLSWNIFLSDLTNHGNVGTVELKFDGLAENLSLFAGVVDHVEYDSNNMTASIYLYDRLAKFLDQEIDPSPTALDMINGLDTNPMDFIWAILVDEGGLDSTVSTDNVDIDYTKWLAVWTKLDGLSFNIGARIPRFHTYRTAIQAVLYICSCQGFITNEGKIGFAYTANDAVAGDDTWTTAHIVRALNGSKIDGHRVYTDLSEIVNDLQTFYTLNLADGTWAGSHSQNDAPSVASYGTFKLKESNYMIWHDDITSAQAHMDWIEDNQKDPKIVSEITTWLYGIRSEIGDTIDLTDVDYGFANKLMKIEKILRIDMDNFTITVQARA